MARGSHAECSRVVSRRRIAQNLAARMWVVAVVRDLNAPRKRGGVVATSRGTARVRMRHRHALSEDRVLNGQSGLLRLNPPPSVFLEGSLDGL